MLILGIETSCDETGIALYETDYGIIGEELYSQTKLHERYGGVVPELASRDHIRKVLPLTRQLLIRHKKQQRICMVLPIRPDPVWLVHLWSEQVLAAQWLGH